jgi:hypothetical protein
MNSLFAAGLFDNPWLVAIFVIVGLLSNWLMKRRQEKETGEQRPEGEPPPVADKPKGFDLEAALRRLLDEEAPAKPPAAPPVIPHASPGRPPSPPVWEDEEYVQAERNWMEEARAQVGEKVTPTPPPLPPVAAVAPRTRFTIRPTAEQAQAARRFAQLNEQGRHQAVVVHGRGRHSRTGSRLAAWRDPQNARQAFVASLVFGTPKGMES